VAHRFEVRGDRIVGGAGYHAGETLHVVRREDGSVSHLECATFVYTRTPYDPGAPIPGGVPDRP
jgi:D-alanyl-D-alanine carboxypeptidase